jgi:hypothetical protein
MSLDPSLLEDRTRALYMALRFGWVAAKGGDYSPDPQKNRMLPKRGMQCLLNGPSLPAGANHPKEAPASQVLVLCKSGSICDRACACACVYSTQDFLDEGLTQVQQKKK